MKTREVINTKRVWNLIVVDESGSMTFIEREALAGINETLATCCKMAEMHPEMEQMVTLVTFDSSHYKVHYDSVPACQTEMLTSKDYCPCGGTPLYDAIGRSVSHLNARVEKGDKVLATIITDGEENCSSEFSLRMVRNLIDKLKDSGWTFALIGTENLDVEDMAHSMAIDNACQFRQNPTETKAMFEKENASRMAFYECCLSGEAQGKGTFFRDEE